MEITNLDEEGVNPPENLYICLVFLFLPFVDSLEFSTINTNNDLNPTSLYWIKPFLATSFYIWNASYRSIQSAFKRSSTMVKATIFITIFIIVFMIITAATMLSLTKMTLCFSSLFIQILNLQQKIDCAGFCGSKDPSYMQNRFKKYNVKIMRKAINKQAHERTIHNLEGFVLCMGQRFDFQRYW